MFAVHGLLGTFEKVEMNKKRLSNSIRFNNPCSFRLKLITANVLTISQNTKFKL